MKSNDKTLDLQDITPSFDFLPFGHLLRPFIDETLSELGKDTWRKSTILIPPFLVWVVLALTLRRDLNTYAVIEWMISATRWIDLNVAVHLLSDGALSHARVALGYEVFALLFRKFTASRTLEPDFHSMVSVVFDGTMLSMPDSETNRAEFGKPGSKRGESAFPQLRMVALMVVATHLVLDFAFGPCRGKTTGERSLMKQILARIKLEGLLFLFDAGFYSFLLAWEIENRKGHFIMKVSNSVKLRPIKSCSYGDGSYLSKITGKVDGRKEVLVVRVICCQIRGFRPFRLITNLLDEEREAREIARHYHQRWEIEIAFDEIKTHQCATLRGESPTVLRSKRNDLVKQELYALMTSYNVIRTLMEEGAKKSGKEVREISFLNSMQAIIDAVPILNWRGHPRVGEAMQHLIEVIGESEIEKARRPRVNPRVVKVKMSKYKKKRKAHQGEKVDYETELIIIGPPNDEGIILPNDEGVILPQAA